jgi:hypothetical protein
MLLMADEIWLQILDVYPELAFRMDSMPPTSSDRATRATESNRASSISCAALLCLSFRPLLFIAVRLNLHI